MSISLKVKIKHQDGTTEEVTVADAILIYERRLQKAKNEHERAHCEYRISQLRARWKKAMRGKVERRTRSRTRASGDL